MTLVERAIIGIILDFLDFANDFEDRAATIAEFFHVPLSEVEEVMRLRAPVTD